MNIPSPITDVAQLHENARTYMSLIARPERMTDMAERNTILKTLSTSRGWFALEEDGEWLLVPAKFGGYAGMTSTAYENHRKKHMHGAEGERACMRVSSYTEVKSGHPAWKKLKMLAETQRGREPSSKAVVYEVATTDNSAALSTADRDKISAVLKVIRSMTFDEPAAARREITAAL